MAEETRIEGNATKKNGLTVIALPPDKAQAVLDFVATMDSDESDSSGYMISLGGAMAGQPLKATQKHATGTGCLSSPTGWRCSDVDRTPDDI